MLYFCHFFAHIVYIALLCLLCVLTPVLPGHININQSIKKSIQKYTAAGQIVCAVRSIIFSELTEQRKNKTVSDWDDCE